MKILSFVTHCISLILLCMGMYIIGEMYIEYGKDIRPFIFIFIWTVGEGVSELSEYLRKKSKK